MRPTDFCNSIVKDEHPSSRRLPNRFEGLAPNGSGEACGSRRRISLQFVVLERPEVFFGLTDIPDDSPLTARREHRANRRIGVLCVRLGHVPRRLVKSDDSCDPRRLLPTAESLRTRD